METTAMETLEIFLNDLLKLDSKVVNLLLPILLWRLLLGGVRGNGAFASVFDALAQDFPPRDRESYKTWFRNHSTNTKITAPHKVTSFATKHGLEFTGLDHDVFTQWCKWRKELSDAVPVGQAAANPGRGHMNAACLYNQRKGKLPSDPAWKDLTDDVKAYWQAELERQNNAPRASLPTRTVFAKLTDLLKRLDPTQNDMVVVAWLGQHGGMTGAVAGKQPVSNDRQPLSPVSHSPTTVDGCLSNHSLRNSLYLLTRSLNSPHSHKLPTFVLCMSLICHRFFPCAGVSSAPTDRGCYRSQTGEQ